MRTENSTLYAAGLTNETWVGTRRDLSNNVVAGDAFNVINKGGGHYAWSGTVPDDFAGTIDWVSSPAGKLLFSPVSAPTSSGGGGGDPGDLELDIEETSIYLE